MNDDQDASGNVTLVDATCSTLEPDPAVSGPVEFVPPHQLRVRGEVTIHSARGLYDALKPYANLAEDCPNSLDLSGVTAFDTAGVQLLIAFKASQRRLAVHSCPDAMRTFLEGAGLTRLLTN
jgi:anti-anti-sigma regulatory factor